MIAPLGSSPIGRSVSLAEPIRPNHRGPPVALGGELTRHRWDAFRQAADREAGREDRNFERLEIRARGVAQELARAEESLRMADTDTRSRDFPLQRARESFGEFNGLLEPIWNAQRLAAEHAAAKDRSLRRW